MARLGACSRLMGNCSNPASFEAARLLPDPSIEGTSHKRASPTGGCPPNVRPPMPIVALPAVILEPRSMVHAEELFPVLVEAALYEFIDEEPSRSVEALRRGSRAVSRAGHQTARSTGSTGLSATVAESRRLCSSYGCREPRDQCRVRTRVNSNVRPLQEENAS
jgi:hypothetical protein